MFVDGYTDTSKINTSLSSGYGRHTQYNIIYSTRSHGSGYLYDDFEEPTISWDATGNGPTSSVTRVASGDADIAIGETMQLATGATNGSLCQARKTLASLPGAKGSIQTQFKQVAASSSFHDMFSMEFNHTSGGKKLVMLFNNTYALLQKADGSAVSMYDPTMLGDYYELWVEWTDLLDGTHKVDIYLGTVFVNSFTITLPSQTAGQAGKVIFQQQSTDTANLSTRVAIITAGSTQLADDLTVVSTDYVTPYDFTTIEVETHVEDVTGVMVIGTDYLLDVKIGSGSWIPLTIVDTAAIDYKGNIDWTKTVHVLTAQYTETTLVGGVPTPVVHPAGTHVAVRQRTINHVLPAIHELSIDTTSHY